MNFKQRNNKSKASRIESTRRLVERMGVDCKLGVALHSQGVSLEELRMLAKGNVNAFLRKAGRRITPEQKKLIVEKHLR